MSPVHLSELQVQAIGQTLKSAREKRGDNVAEAAFKIALSPSQLRAIEAGDLRPFYSPNYFLQAAQRYADLLGVQLPAPPEIPEPETKSPDITAAEPPPALTTPMATSEVARSPQAAQEPANLRPAADPESDAPLSQPTGGGLRWGWIAFGAAVLITLGILKIGLEPPPKPEPKVIAATTPAAPSAEEVKPAAAEIKPPAVETKPAAAEVKPTPAQPNTRPPQSATSQQDGQLIMQASTWVQIVKNNGEKTNLKAEPGQKVEFLSSETAAVVFGQPEKASLTIQGKSVNLAPFITQDSPPRALVIVNRINQ